MSRALTPTTSDTFWGPDAHQRFDHYKNPTRVQGGNPVFIYRHGGGWTSKDKRIVSTNADESAVMACWLLDRTLFDVISIETRQARWDTPTSGAAFGYNEPRTTSAFFPETFQDMQRAVLEIKKRGASIGIDPNRIILGGSSSGAVMAIWSQLASPIYATGYGSKDRRWGATGGFDSRVCGVWAQEPVLDFRLDGSTESVQPLMWNGMIGYRVNATTGAFLTTVPTALREAVSPMSWVESGDTQWWTPLYISYGTDVFGGIGATWTQSSATITKTGGFTGYDVVTGDKIFLQHPTAGSKLLTIATNPSDDTITTSTDFYASNLTNVSFEVRYAKPYGGTPSIVRDPHMDLDTEKFVALCRSKSLPIGARKYASFSDSDAEASAKWMQTMIDRVTDTVRV